MISIDVEKSEFCEFIQYRADNEALTGMNIQRKITQIKNMQKKNYPKY